MCVKEGGDGRAVGGGVSSIIHQLVLLIYLTPRGAERDLPPGSAVRSLSLSRWMLTFPSLFPLSPCTPSSSSEDG